MITDLSEKSPDKFLDFWKEFGQCLKEGLVKISQTRKS